MTLTLLFVEGISAGTAIRLNNLLPKGKLKRVTMQSKNTDYTIMTARLQRSSEEIASPGASIDLIQKGRAVQGDEVSWEGDLEVDPSWRLVWIFVAPLNVGDGVRGSAILET